MGSDNKIQIEIEVNGQKALATIGLTEDNIRKLGASFNDAKRQTGDFSRDAVQNLTDVRNVVQGLEGIWRTFNATFNRSFALYERQINAEQRLEAVLRASGREVVQNSARLRDMASALQQATTFGDEQILEAQAVLLTFQNIGLETLPRVTEAALDMASVLGGDAVSSARQLARALEDPERGLDTLRRTGVTFTREMEEQIRQLAASGRQMEAQSLILAELENRFKGTAKAIADTPAGRFRQLQNELGDVREEMGAFMATGIGPVVAGLSTLLKTSNELSPVITGAIGLTGSLTATYVALNVTGLLPILRGLAIWKPAVTAIPAQSAIAAGGINTLTISFRGATVAARTFFASLGPIGWAALGIGALIPIVGMFASKNKDAALATDELDTALRSLTLDQKREKLRELGKEVQALSNAIRAASDSDWRREQVRNLESLQSQYQQLAKAALMQDSEQLTMEIDSRSVTLRQVETELAGARERLLSARGRFARAEAMAEVRGLMAQADTLKAQVQQYQDQLNLLRERQAQHERDRPLTPEQQRQAEQLRLDIITDARDRELATLRLWYNQQRELADGQQDNLSLLELAYANRRSAINDTYRERELTAQRTFAGRILAIQDDFRRIEGQQERRILADRLERIELAYQGEAEGTDLKKQLYLDLLQARLELAREEKRISDEASDEDKQRNDRREQLLAEITRQELEMFEATERLELARTTLNLPYEQRRLAELVLEQNLLLNRKSLLEEELQAVQDNVDLTIEERQRQANAVTIELLRIEQGLRDIDQAAADLEETFEWTFGTVVGYTKEILGAFQDMFRSLNQLYQQDARRKIDAEMRKRNTALDTSEQEALAAAQSAEERSAIELVYEERRAVLEEEALRMKAEAARKFFTLQQVASVGQATMSTYEAATKALTIPPPFGQILAGILTAAGLANVAVIASQEPPAFADGGLFRGAGGPTEDANLVRLSNGEYIVNAASTSRYLPWLEEINTNRFAPDDSTRALLPAVSPDFRYVAQSLLRVGKDIARLANRPLLATASIPDFQTAAIVNRGSRIITNNTYDL